MKYVCSTGTYEPIPLNDIQAGMSIAMIGGLNMSNPLELHMAGVIVLAQIVIVVFYKQLEIFLYKLVCSIHGVHRVLASCNYISGKITTINKC